MKCDISDKLDELIKKNGYGNRDNLLIKIFIELGRDNPYEAMEKNKGNFSKMMRGTRGFPMDYIIAMEKLLKVSFANIVDGGENSYIIKNKRTLESVAIKDRYEEYLLLDNDIDIYEESVLSNRDEYGKSIIDYIIQYDSIEGIRYLVENKSLKFICDSNSFNASNLSSFIFDMKNHPLLIANLLKEDTKLFSLIFDTYDMLYGVARNSLYIDKEFFKVILSSEKLLKHILSYKKLKLMDVNYGLLDEENEGLFLNPVVNYLLNYVLENSELYMKELDIILEYGKKYNEMILVELEKQNLDKELINIDDLGHLKMGRTIYFSIVKYKNEGDYPSSVKEKLDKLNFNI